MKKIKELLEKYYDLVAYIFFGVLTTGVHFIVSSVCHYAFSLHADTSTDIAWVVAVIFAYLTNKPFVFKSNDWSIKTVAPEFLKFAGGRIVSGLLVRECMRLTVDERGWNFILMYIVTSVLNIVLNYIASKLIVFTKKK
jgi:putative flippase GtrA